MAQKCNYETCNNWSMQNSDFCYWHNPDIPESEKQKARSRGGSNSKKLSPSTDFSELPKGDGIDLVEAIADNAIEVHYQNLGQPQKSKELRAWIEIKLKAITIRELLPQYKQIMERQRILDEGQNVTQLQPLVFVEGEANELD